MTAHKYPRPIPRPSIFIRFRVRYFGVTKVRTAAVDKGTKNVFVDRCEICNEYYEDVSHGYGRRMTCPRCGRETSEPNVLAYT